MEEFSLEMKTPPLKFKNPVILGLGPLSVTEKSFFNAEELGYGGIVTKTVTSVPLEGNPRPRRAFKEGYLVGADGLPNPGYKAMVTAIESAKKRNSLYTL